MRLDWTGCFNEIVSPASLHGVSLMLSQNISPPPTSVRNKSTQIMATPIVCCYLRPSDNRMRGGLWNVTSKVHFGKSSIEMCFTDHIFFVHYEKDRYHNHLEKGIKIGTICMNTTFIARTLFGPISPSINGVFFF